MLVILRYSNAKMTFLCHCILKSYTFNWSVDEIFYVVYSDELPLDSNISDEQRREMIKSQLEYYFSRWVPHWKLHILVSIVIHVMVNEHSVLFVQIIINVWQEWLKLLTFLISLLHGWTASPVGHMSRTWVHILAGWHLNGIPFFTLPDWLVQFVYYLSEVAMKCFFHL